MARTRPLTSRHPAERALPWDVLCRAAQALVTDAAGKSRAPRLTEIAARVEEELGVTGMYQVVQRRMERMRKSVVEHACDGGDHRYWASEASVAAVAAQFVLLRRTNKIEVDVERG